MTTMPMPAPEMTVGRQGFYAGAVSRLVAFGADVGASWGLYLLGQALINWAIRLVTGHSYTITNHRLVAFIVLGVWEFIYFSYQWAVSGRTLGMAIFGLQVVTRVGAPIGIRQAIVRTLSLAITLPIFLIAFWGIIFQRERRAFNDLMAGTAVVYSWDARAAHLRWLARTEGTMQRGALHHQVSERQPKEGHGPAS
jgi:uncharacterized RDD family membrane protein YckC